MRRLCIVFVACAACGGDHTTTLKCATGTSGLLTSDSPVTVGGGGADLHGASIAATPHTTLPDAEVSIDCADDIVPAGYIALGPAVTFGAEGTWSDRPFELTLPYKAARLPDGAARRHVRIVAKRANSDKTYFPAVSNRVIDDHDAYASRATFSSGLLTTYQVVALETAGQSETQPFGWNAIAGRSA